MGVGWGGWAGRGGAVPRKKQAGEQEAGGFAGETPGLHCPQLSLGPSLHPAAAFFPYPVSGRPHFNEGLRTQAFTLCSLVIQQNGTGLFLQCFYFLQRKRPKEALGQRSQEFNSLLFLPFPYFYSFFPFFKIAL